MDAKLIKLCGTGRHLMRDIAEEIGVTIGRAHHRKLVLGLSNWTALCNRRTKHRHLQKEVLEYFQDHTAEECQKRFGLTKTHFNSCMTSAYQRPEFAHIRKDTRRHDAWTLKETLYLLRRSGLLPRKEIAHKLKRGGVHSVKEQLSRICSGSKFLNGMPVGWAIEALPQYVVKLPKIKTTAGPTGGRGGFEFNIIPWVRLDSLSGVPDGTMRCIRIMARFQRWIFGGRSDEAIIRFIKRVTTESWNERERAKHRNQPKGGRSK